MAHAVPDERARGEREEEREKSHDDRELPGSGHDSPCNNIGTNFSPGRLAPMDR